MTIKTICDCNTKNERSKGAILKKLIKKSKNNDVFYKISLHFIYKVHLPPGVYKILSAFDAS